MLELPHDWAWDSWVADDGERYHLYFLRAPRALKDPALRHARSRIGHATSTDLRTWTDHGEVLGPTEGGWDDLALWTGSVVRDDAGQWRMFYTAINTGGHGLKDQRIGVAVSDDLDRWRKIGTGPVLAPDRRWYRTLDENPAVSETWRDPFVYRDPDGHGWCMILTARVAGGSRNDDGVLAFARSGDLETWELQPPITQPGTGFGQLEVVQVRRIDGQWVLVFTCHPDEQAPQRRADVGQYCTWSVLGPSAAGPWDIAAAQPFTAEPHLFAAPLVQQRDGTWAFIGFRNREPEGIHSFDIVDPIPLAVRDGRLVADPGPA
jgi:beta-fructofuranosidase